MEIINPIYSVMNHNQQNEKNKLNSNIQSPFFLNKENLLNQNLKPNSWNINKNIYNPNINTMNNSMLNSFSINNNNPNNIMNNNCMQNINPNFMNTNTMNCMNMLNNTMMFNTFFNNPMQFNPMPFNSNLMINNGMNNNSMNINMQLNSPFFFNNMMMPQTFYNNGFYPNMNSMPFPYTYPYMNNMVNLNRFNFIGTNDSNNNNNNNNSNNNGNNNISHQNLDNSLNLNSYLNNSVNEEEYNKLKKQFIKELDAFQYKNKDKFEKALIENECSICLCKYKITDILKILPCKHGFHNKCIKKWLSNEEHNKCPLCNLDLKVEVIKRKADLEKHIYDDEHEEDN